MADKIKCDNPCTDYILGGCGKCPPSCHQPPWHYDKNFKEEMSEEVANMYSDMKFINGEWQRSDEARNKII